MVKEVIIHQFISWIRNGFEYFNIDALRISLDTCTINVADGIGCVRCNSVCERFDYAIPSK